MRQPNQIHYNPMHEQEAWCGTKVWRNWTPSESGVECKKCLRMIAESHEYNREAVHA